MGLDERSQDLIEGNGIGREEIGLDRRKWDWMGGVRILQKETGLDERSQDWIEGNGIGWEELRLDGMK